MLTCWMMSPIYHVDIGLPQWDQWGDTFCGGWMDNGATGAPADQGTFSWHFGGQEGVYFGTLHEMAALETSDVVSGPFFSPNPCYGLPYGVLDVSLCGWSNKNAAFTRVGTGMGDWGSGDGGVLWVEPGWKFLKYTKPPLLCGDNLTFYLINIVN